MRQEIKRI